MLFFEENGDTIKCKFQGELTTHICAELEKELNRHITDFFESHDNAKVVFDLEETIYICSAFLHRCLYYCKTAGSYNFRITGVQPSVMNILNLAGFTEIMTVEVA